MKHMKDSYSNSKSWLPGLKHKFAEAWSVDWRRYNPHADLSLPEIEDRDRSAGRLRWDDFRNGVKLKGGGICTCFALKHPYMKCRYCRWNQRESSANPVSSNGSPHRSPGQRYKSQNGTGLVFLGGGGWRWDSPDGGLATAGWKRKMSMGLTGGFKTSNGVKPSRWKLRNDKSHKSHKWAGRHTSMGNANMTVDPLNTTAHGHGPDGINDDEGHLAWCPACRRKAAKWRAEEDKLRQI